mmetsp:Transcript_28964/g.21556  ORF Transcript_28964/g.21556 Transcript_28964/m.21556 type:complete len:185 (+) Transcript_28964:1-555(+)
MVTIRPINMFDLLKYNNVNLDILTETFYTSFYGQYLSKWQEYCVVAENSVSMLQGYLLGKVEGDKNSEAKKNWHGHVSAVTVAPDFRRSGLARSLMDYLEEVTDKRHNGFFVDLFVRPSNVVAINMYKNLGYIVYRTVVGYYNGTGDESTEDAYDMRKAMPRDKEKTTVVPLDHPIQPSELEFH